MDFVPLPPPSAPHVMVVKGPEVRQPTFVYTQTLHVPPSTTEQKRVKTAQYAPDMAGFVPLAIAQTSPWCYIENKGGVRVFDVDKHREVYRNDVIPKILREAHWDIQQSCTLGFMFAYRTHFSKQRLPYLIQEEDVLGGIQKYLNERNMTAAQIACDPIDGTYVVSW